MKLPLRRLHFSGSRPDTEAKHALVLDREARKLFVAPIAQASRFLQEQLVNAPKTVGKI
jgi:hypothetical protein